MLIDPLINPLMEEFHASHVRRYRSLEPGSRTPHGPGRGGRAGHEKIITRNGRSYVALIDARRLDYYHRLEREHVHLILLEEAARGLDDVSAGRLMSVAELRGKYRKVRKR